MSGSVGSGGRATLPDGAAVVWSVAEGLRGRRWREAVTRDGALGRSLLLEVSPAGRPTRLELTSAAGLLTLHPDRDGRELHGNVVTPTGVRHLRFDWSAEHDLVVAGSPAAAAVALRRFADILAVGESQPGPVVWIDDALEPRAGAWQVTRTAPFDWRTHETEGADGTAGTEGRDGGEGQSTTLDEAGMPIAAGGRRWPLERA